MAKHLIKLTILFVAFQQVIRLNEATSLSRPPTEDPTEPTAFDENTVSAPFTADSDPLTAYEISNPPPLEETSDPFTADESITSDPSDTDDNNNANLRPTNPLEMNKIAFQPLVTLYGRVGPLIYDLLTDENALGKQMAVVSKVIADKITLDGYAEDINTILSNLLNAEVTEKVSDVYDKIKDVEAQGSTKGKLQDAVEIIMNILNDDNAVKEIDEIIKKKPV